MDEVLIAGEHCLKLFLENNNNSCPIQPHDNCQYSRNNAVRKYIDDLTVICIRQFEQEIKISHKTEREGEIPGVIKCDFKGKLKDLNNHLINECPLNLINCLFKPFGCNHTCFSYNLKDHLITNMKLHFDLVTQLLQSMKQEIQLKDNRIKQMERDYQQELLKYRADIEMIKRDFNEKEKQVLSNHAKIVKALEEKNSKLTQDYELLLQKLNHQHKEEEKVENKKQSYEYTALSSLSINFNLFRSSYKLINTFNGHTNIVPSIDYSTFDDCQFICSGSYDKTVRVWDINKNKQIQSFNRHLLDVCCVKFSQYHYHNHHCNVVCSSSSDKTIRFWDFKYNQQLQVFNGHTNWVYGIEFSPFNGSRYLCSGSGDKTIRLWDVETYKSLHVFNGHTKSIRCIDISPLQSNNNNNKNNDIGMIGGNGYTICSGSSDHTIRIWDIETTKQLIVFKGHKYDVNSVKYGSNELVNIILSGSDDESVHLWDIRSNKQIQMFKGHTNNVHAVEYSPFAIKIGDEVVSGNSNVICSGSLDNTIRFWIFDQIRKNYNGITCLTFISLKKKVKNYEQKSKDDCGIYLYYGSKKGPIRVWG
ncbi:hypothetical protein RFI_30374 [Reticulomyxa filosa]|uniref:Uncharacterized protein n=1 Tax=Reticulomyxa filosa TaxID=46433 RepID=X6LYM3_RETFI|nr:hypothetical protein RFI_30374 [Reticulomyxa filosa]|eukprot:ETO07018.1 hypothetical protein RFI_30374 [Reticulomyxa filosa]